MNHTYKKARMFSAPEIAPQPSPLLAMYNEIRSKLAPGTVLLYRLGDFYEVLGDDAPRVAKLLEITLTHRREIPMCGIPFHCLDSWSKKLLAAGLLVATAEYTRT